MGARVCRIWRRCIETHSNNDDDAHSIDVEVGVASSVDDDDGVDAAAADDDDECDDDDDDFCMVVDDFLYDFMNYYKDQYEQTKEKELQSKIDTLDKIITYTTYIIIGMLPPPHGHA